MEPQSSPGNPQSPSPPRAPDTPTLTCTPPPSGLGFRAAPRLGVTRGVGGVPGVGGAQEVLPQQGHPLRLELLPLGGEGGLVWGGAPTPRGSPDPWGGSQPHRGGPWGAVPQGCPIPVGVPPPRDGLGGSLWWWGGVHGVPTSRARRSAASVKVRRSRVRAPCSRRSRRHSCSSPGVGGLGAASTAAIASCTTGIREGARGRPGTPRQGGGIPESPPQPHYLQAAVLQGDHLPPGCRLLPQPLQLLLQVGVPSGGRGVLGGVGGVLGAPVGSLLPAGEG